MTVNITYSTICSFDTETKIDLLILISVIFRVYCADHTYCTLRLPVDTTAETIKIVAADKLKMRDDELLLVEVRSNGERVPFKDNDISIPTALSINSRIMVSPKDHLDALVSHTLTFIFTCKFDQYSFRHVCQNKKKRLKESTPI